MNVIDPILAASIVLVDDEPANLRLLERFLAPAGFERVRAFRDGSSALAAMDAEPADLVLPEGPEVVGDEGGERQEQRDARDRGDDP